MFYKNVNSKNIEENQDYFNDLDENQKTNNADLENNPNYTNESNNKNN